jgi:hypothetical protein
MQFSHEVASLPYILYEQVHTYFGVPIAPTMTGKWLFTLMFAVVTICCAFTAGYGFIKIKNFFMAFAASLGTVLAYGYALLYSLHTAEDAHVFSIYGPGIWAPLIGCMFFLIFFGLALFFAVVVFTATAVRKEEQRGAEA